MAGVPIKKKTNKKGKAPRAMPMLVRTGFTPGRAFKSGGKKQSKRK